jgi:acetyltransferase
LTGEAPEPGIFIAPAERLAEAAFQHAGRADLGGVLVVHAPSGPEDEAAIQALSQPPKTLRAPVLVCAMGETTGAMHRATLARAGLPVFATPDQAVQGFGYLVRDRRNREAARELPPSRVLALEPDRGLVRNRFARVRAAGRLTLASDEALEVLEAYGIPAVPTRFAASPADAGIAAGMLGFPAVVKLRSVDPPAERPPASLIFDLHDAAHVTSAARLLAARAQRRGDGTELLVQRYVGRAREVAVRVADDATFGPTITFGAGGTTPNPADRAVDLPPLNLARAWRSRCATARPPAPRRWRRYWCASAS